MKIRGWLLGLGLMAVLGLVGRCDYEMELADEARYNAKVAEWKADEAAGVPEYARHGWPPYKERERW